MKLICSLMFLALFVSACGGNSSSSPTSPTATSNLPFSTVDLRAGTGAEAHSHPNEQWIYILEGTFAASVGGKPRSTLRKTRRAVWAGEMRMALNSPPNLSSHPAPDPRSMISSA